MIYICIIIAPTSNLLCHFESDDYWNVIKGNWIKDPNTCIVENTDDGFGNIIWLGDENGTIPDINWIYSSFTIRVEMSIVDDNSGIGNGGILFRALNVSDINNGGQQYYVGLNIEHSRIELAKINNGLYESIAVGHGGHSFDYGEIYLITIISRANGLIYIDLEGDELLITHQLNDIFTGSIGLRTFQAPNTKYYNLTLNQIFTNPPTLLPTVPTYQPTLQPTSGMFYPCLYISIKCESLIYLIYLIYIQYSTNK